MSDSRFFRRYMDILNEEQYDPEVQAIIDALKPPPGYTGPGTQLRVPEPQGGQEGTTGPYDPEVQAIIDALSPPSGYQPDPSQIERLDLPDGRIIYYDRRGAVELRGGGSGSRPAPSSGGQSTSRSSTDAANDAITGRQ